MQITGALIEEIDFDWANLSGVRLAQRLPRKFLEMYFHALEHGEEFVDYWCRGGRVVGRIHPDGHLDYIVNPEPTMVKNWKSPHEKD